MINYWILLDEYSMLLFLEETDENGLSTFIEVRLHGSVS
jgi:hypothetical protein